MADTLDREDKIPQGPEWRASPAELRTPVAVLQAGHEALLDSVTEPDPEEARVAPRRGAPRSPAWSTTAADDGRRRRRGPAADQGTARPRRYRRVRGRQPGPQISRRRRSSSTASWPAAPVLADGRWMHQVVTNLLGNALKFTPVSGIVHPSAPARVRDQAGRPSAVLEVADNGVGIPADELPRVFDRFWRGWAAAQTSGERHWPGRRRRDRGGAHGGCAPGRQRPGTRDAPHPDPSCLVTSVC